MAEKISRLAYLLGELRRQMNGAVVGAMRFYGAEYGLNYGVSLPTIRSIAREELSQHGVDHRFARQMFLQEVRELRLVALHLADVEAVGASDSEMAFWAAGIVNSEVAEEASFALMWRVERVAEWLSSESELLRYCALLSISKRGDAAKYLDTLPLLLDREVHILPKAIVVVLESALRNGVEPSVIESVIASLPEGASGVSYIREEMAWRVELV